MKARTLKSEFFADERLAGLPVECRLFVLGAASLCDKHGVLENRPLRIKTASMPYDEVDPERTIGMLLNGGILMKSECCRFLMISMFSDWFQPWNKEAEYDISECVFRETTVELTVATDKLPSSNPVAYSKHKGQGQGKGQGKEKPVKKIVSKPVKPQTTEPTMEELYGVLAELVQAVEPNEVWDHARAKKAYWTIVSNWHPTKNPKPKGVLLGIIESVRAGTSLRDIAGGAESYKDENINKPQFMVMLAEWIKNEGWNPYTRSSE